VQKRFRNAKVLSSYRRAATGTGQRRFKMAGVLPAMTSSDAGARAAAWNAAVAESASLIIKSSMQ